MIITKLQGGLGNQLFQWAATYSASKKLNCKYFFDLNFYNHSIDRPFMLSKFNLHIEKYSGPYVKLNFVNDSFEYSPITDNCFLDGYWQSEKYFMEHRNEILELLAFKNIKDKDYFIKYPFLTKNTASIHVRRGDYTQSQNTHPIQSIEYYVSAIKKVSPEHVLIFSDDINWCKKYLRFDNCKFIENEDEISSLYIMSLCKSNIIANSTFSWWGAWLNKNEEKKVIAPRNWFGPSGPKKWENIYCKNWDII